MQLLGSCTCAHFLDHCNQLYGAVHRGLLARTPEGSAHVYDDYAHHPTEVGATLSAIRGKHPAAAMVAVWQPISRARLRTFMHEFCVKLEPASSVIIAPMDTSREAADAATDGVLLREACTRLDLLEQWTAPGQAQRACISATCDDVIKAVHDAVAGTWNDSPGVDVVVVFMGSGNISQMAQEFSGLLDGSGHHTPPA